MAPLSISDFEKDLQRKKSCKDEFLEILDRLFCVQTQIELTVPYYSNEPNGSGDIGCLRSPGKELETEYSDLLCYIVIV